MAGGQDRRRYLRARVYKKARDVESARRGLSRVPAHFGHQPAAAVVALSDTRAGPDCPETRIGRGDLATEIADLKREPGKNMIEWGGAAFAQSLTRLGLVDEYRLVLQPVALGHELPLFKGLTAPLHLVSADDFFASAQS